MTASRYKFHDPDFPTLVGPVGYFTRKIVENWCKRESSMRGGTIFQISDKFWDGSYNADVGPKFIEPLKSILDSDSGHRIYVSAGLQHFVWTNSPDGQIALMLALYP